MIVFLVPAGGARYELYSEPPEEPAAAPAPHDGAFRRWAHAGSTKWHEMVAAARQGTPAGRLARWRDAIVCRLAESIAEQRTLWALTDTREALLRYPSTIPAENARSVLIRLLETSRGHHLKWLVIDALVFVSSAVLAIVPGPNLFAYYFAFRLLGHLQSWRGARQGKERIVWQLEEDAGLSELASLVDLPRETRAPRVAAIAARLKLHRLAAFFDRVAVPSA
jgi:hypothetical protein